MIFRASKVKRIFDRADWCERYVEHDVVITSSISPIETTIIVVFADQQTPDERQTRCIRCETVGSVNVYSDPGLGREIQGYVDDETKGAIAELPKTVCYEFAQSSWAVGSSRHVVMCFPSTGKTVELITRALVVEDAISEKMN